MLNNNKMSGSPAHACMQICICIPISMAWPSSALGLVQSWHAPFAGPMSMPSVCRSRSAMLCRWQLQQSWWQATRWPGRAGHPHCSTTPAALPASYVLLHCCCTGMHACQAPTVSTSHLVVSALAPQCCSTSTRQQLARAEMRYCSYAYQWSLNWTDGSCVTLEVLSVAHRCLINKDSLQTLSHSRAALPFQVHQNMRPGV